MTWLPTSIFIASGIGQCWFMWRVGSALRMRHPEMHQKMLGFGGHRRLLWFAISRGDKTLQDADLTSKTKLLQTFGLIAIASWLAAVVLLMTGHS